MRSRDEVLEILRKELPYLRRKYGVKAIGVFGSYARNDRRSKVILIF